MLTKLYVGVDLGGTNIKVGICDEQGSLLHKYEGPTYAEQGPEAVIARIAEYVKTTVDISPFQWEQIEGIGAGIAGFVNIQEGVMKLAPNLRWRDVPIKQPLEQHLGKRVEVNNDANVAALGESWSGAGIGVSNLVCYTLGTGVGGGLIINGSIYEGFNGSAGELGHLKVVPDLEAIQCGCGQMGCLETVSSATGIVRMANVAVERGDITLLSELRTITAKDVFDAAISGDEVAQRIVQRAAYYIGKSMAIVAVIMNPQLFVIGGGVSKAGEILLEPIRKSFVEHTTELVHEGVHIVPAQLGNDAGVIGAAGLIAKIMQLH